MSSRMIIGLLAGTLAMGASAQSMSGREAFAAQQALGRIESMERQFDVMQNNFDELARRVGKLEAGGGESDSLRAEIQSLRSQVSELRQKLGEQRNEIVKDISGRVTQIVKENRPAPAPVHTEPARPVAQGPLKEYIVQSGDNLYLVAMAFKTSVAKLKEINNLKKDSLRVGQKLYVPAGK